MCFVIMQEIMEKCVCLSMNNVCDVEGNSQHWIFCCYPRKQVAFRGFLVKYRNTYVVRCGLEYCCAWLLSQRS